MSTELDARKDHGSQPDLGRRQLGVGLLAALGGCLGVVNTGEAFPGGFRGHFNAASRLLDRYGVTVKGDTSQGHDAVNFTVAPLVGTEYTQTIAMPNRIGELSPCFRTAVFEGDVTATHFHETRDGEVLPCFRTTVEGHSLATHELFDLAEGDIVPCFKVVSEMREGGVLGAVEVAVDPDVDLMVRVGARTYRLTGGALVLV